MKPASLIETIYNNDVRAVEMAIAAGADVNALPSGGHLPPLHAAIEHHRVEIVRRLIVAGVLLNVECRDIGGPGWTPLVHAIDIESDSAWQAHHEKGHESTALTELLLASGAVPTNRAFEIAKNYGNEKALALLRLYAGQGIADGRS